MSGEAPHDADAAGSSPLSVGQAATLACLLEVTAPKVGNVHRGADFAGATFNDFVVSAVAIGPAIESAGELSVGRAAFEAVRATRRLVATNTNLGAILLLAPLAAAAARGGDLRRTTATLLAELSAADAEYVWRAINLAQPGGLGETDSHDLAGPAPADLLEAMRLAADRDLVARQYVTEFAIIFEHAAPWLTAGRERGWSLTESIVHTHQRLIAEYGDSLILRKCGDATARKAQAMAAEALKRGAPGDEDYYRALADLDFWMRSDGNRRNPGTTADLIAAGLFVGLLAGRLKPPFR